MIRTRFNHVSQTHLFDAFSGLEPGGMEAKMKSKEETMQFVHDTKYSRLLTLTSGWLLFLATVTVAGADLNTGVLSGKIQLSSGTKAENTLVYLEGVTGEFETQKEPVEMGQENKVFIPHLLPVQRGQTVHFTNSDSFSHNVHSYWGRRSLFNVAQGIHGKHDWTPPRAGEYLVLCDIHREMSAFVFVFDHPFFASVDRTGGLEFKIQHIPEGTYTLVSVRDIKGRLKRQKQEVTITAGQTTAVTVQF